MSSLPKPYNRVHVFGTASSNTPANPIQGVDLDAEFNAVEIALDETQARLALIQRDDGELANDSVGPDQLTDEATEDLENAAADAAQEVIDAGIVEITQIKNEAAAEADAAAASAAQAQTCADQSCACAAASADSAEASEDSAEDSAAEATDAANSADLARYYYEQLDGAVAQLQPLTVTFLTVASTPSKDTGRQITGEEFIDVHVDGLLLDPSKYSVAGSTVTFTPPIATGKTVVIKIAGATQIMPIVVDDWGYVYESAEFAEDWGSIAA